MILRVSVEGADARVINYIVDARDRATVGDLAGAIGGSRSSVVSRLDGAGRAAIMPRQLLAESEIRDGDVLSLHAGPATSGSACAGGDDRGIPAGPAVWSLEVTSGPDAGKTFPLRNGTWTLGRSSVSTIRLSDTEVSRQHGRLTVSSRQVLVCDTGSSNGTELNGKPVHGELALEPGAQLKLGTSTLTLFRVDSGASTTSDLVDLIGAPGGARASVEPDGRGGLLLNRVPSLRSPYLPRKVSLPSLPRPREKRGLPWLSALLPLLFAGGIYLATKQTSFLLFAFLSPVTLGANAYTNRRLEKKRAKREGKQYQESLAETRAEIEAAVADELSWLVQSTPTGAVAAQIASVRGARLWERSSGDVDFMELRVGQGRVKASVEVSGSPDTEGTATEIPQAPLTVQLREAGVVGVAGPRVLRDELARSMVVQLACLHAADEVRIVLLADGATEQSWGYLRWLPHCWQANERRADIERTPIEIAAKVKYLLGVAADRSPDSRETGEAGLPAYVIILQDAAALRRRPDVAELLSVGQRVGIYAIALDDEARLLPEECRVIARVDASGVVVEDIADRRTCSGATDRVTVGDAARAARALAPIRRVGRHQSASLLPDRLSLFELLGGRPTGNSTTRMWGQGKGERTSIPVGVGAAGTVELDIVHSGPHALIGGTSGSGKSEFVQTWVASMAYHNRPDELTFLFIEYKGLSAFLRLQHLPHCVGTITNLSPELTSRALASLTAEMQRRQRLMFEASVSDIRGYREARASRPELSAMPRLLIVLDEFAEMKQQLPDFVEGLISVARTGRSLGVHLILATQQVGRAVSADIAGNANLRISLRAAVPEDSFAVIGSNAASKIAQHAKGRAIAKRGDLPLETFQTAWSGGPVDGTEVAPVVAEPWPWNDAELRYQTIVGRPITPVTELDDVVETIVQAASASAIVTPRRPFSEPLPTFVSLAQLSAEAPVDELAALVQRGGPVIGRRDDLALQIQEPYAVPLLRGHVAIIGSATTGRTTALRTSVAAWATSVPPSMVHIHAIDGARGLVSLTALPHVGTVATVDDPRAARVLNYLATEVNRRLKWLADKGVGDLLEWWGHPEQEDPVPWILLVIDRFEDILSATERGPAEAALERILSHGTAAGITVLAAGDETLARNRWQNRFPTRLVLRNFGGLDSAQVGLPPRVPLHDLPRGRAYETDTASQVQIAVVGTSHATGAQNEGLRALGSKLAQRWADLGSATPLRLRDLPAEVPVADLPAPRTGDGVVLGLGGDAAEPIELTRAHLPLLVVGPDRSGRSETLRRMAVSWVAAGRSVIVAGSSHSGLVIAPPAGTRVIDYAGDEPVDWQTLLASPDLGVVVDDLHGDDVPDALVATITSGLPICLFAGAMRALTMVPAPLKALARGGTLLYLCPADPRLVGYYDIRVDASSCFTEPVGRGILVSGERPAIVQVAFSPA